MASFRASVKPNLTRAKGDSVVNRAAYITREKILDERIGKTFNYTGEPDKALLVGARVPNNAPEWAKDIGQLANAMEAAEKRKDAQLARPMELNLPHELTLEQAKWYLEDYIRENFTRKGYAVIFAIHAAPEQGDERNIHAHLLISLRTIDENGFSKSKAQEQENFRNKSEYSQGLRENWAKLGARHLERHGFAQEAEKWRHGHLKLEEQAELARARGDLDYAKELDREATKHLGQHAAAMEAKGTPTDRGDINREIEERNRERDKLKDHYAALRDVQAEISAELQRQHEAAKADVRREREAKAAAEEKAKQAAATPDGMTAKLDAWQRENAAAQIREAWRGSSGDGLAFMVNLGAHGLSMAKNEWGAYVLVSEKGRVQGLSAAQYGPDAKAIKQAIDAARAEHAALEIPGVEDLRHEQAQRREQEKKEREERQQQEKQERSYQASLDLTPTQATIRQSFGATMSGQSFAAAIEHNGFVLAKASKGDVETAQVLAGLNSHIKDAPDWQTRAAIKEGDYLVIDERGHAHRLTERTTGADPGAIAGKLANLAATPLPDVQEGKEIMRDVKQQTATEKRMERERQQQHNSNQRAAIRYAVPAPHPSWQAEPWKKVQQVDATPRPMHPDAHADRLRQQQAERHRQSEDERETRKHNPAMMKDAAQEATARPQDSSDGQQKTAQQERKEKLMKLALANLETRGLDRGGGRTRDR